MAIYLEDDFVGNNTQFVDSAKWNSPALGFAERNRIFSNAGAANLNNGCSQMRSEFQPATPDYQVRAVIRFYDAKTTTQRIYLYLRSTNGATNQTGYRLRFMGDDSLDLDKYDAGGNPTNLFSSTYGPGFNLGQSYTVIFGVKGNQLSLSIDGVDIPLPADSEITATGLAAWYTNGSYNSRIGNIWIEDIPDSVLEFTGSVEDQSYPVDQAITPLDLSTHFSGGAPPYTYAVTAGTLPTGLSLDTNTGIISGTPTVELQSSDIEVTATDQDTDTATTNSFQLSVTGAANSPPVEIAPIADFSGTDGQAVTQRDISSNFFDADGDTLTFTQSGDWPAGVTLSSNGLIAGTYGEAGTFIATVDFSDGVNPPVTSTPFTFNVAVAGASSTAAFTEPLDAGGGTPATDVPFTGTFFPDPNNIGAVADGAFFNVSGTTSGTGGVSVDVGVGAGVTGLLIITTATGIYAAEEVTTT